MTPLERLRLEKASADCGFERTPILLNDGGMELRSALFPEAIFVHIQNSGFRVSASTAALLDGASNSTVSVVDLDRLYAVLQRASAIGRTMPNRVADQFRRATKHLPQTTEAERLAVQRVGQDLYRGALMDYWQGCCCVTGLAVPALLRASHIKPWAKCQSDDERLDVFNGLLLAPHIDALFDGGWISFSDQGSLLVSDALPSAARAQLGVSPEWSIRNLKPAHAPYLMFHRDNELRKVSSFSPCEASNIQRREIL
ncbi:HNH endonuclease [Burkholderia pseudomallei]|uniref:HNH endonuclease n=1 Tax=Burkholderia pseudomallei TaxID=28450 RepID=UPI000537E828|nr:HNH endonuclease [Burkholderia pseudomallei]KGV24543.1 HNH endonuclease family protein [Burkholderia pseudomallei MSHR4462]KGX04509.1 HNH endonuclease family protein [Burkholderia pseudomallei MSHR640]